ncbi:AraC family transcriptional regulator [Vallitalea okinawensis]|uniref:AraC family transcriptional regulator n=1 Tax=Vallitalea okinawensis TaxID=2078660 RepID=UPI000CFC2294|nr:AraC family transcriptional regulator [Vallitalea okinawensis]
MKYNLPLIKRNDYEFKISNMDAPKKTSDMTFVHYHNSYEIYYLFEGKRSFFVKDRTYLLKKGDLIFINKNIIHRTLKVEQATHKRIMIEFKEQLVDKFKDAIHDVNILNLICEDYNLIQLDYKKQIYLDYLFNRMINEEQEQFIGYESTLKLLLIELLIFIHRNASMDLKSNIQHPTTLHHKVSDIVKYINMNFGKNIHLYNLSELYFISPNYLSRIFREATGFTFTEYLNHVRINEAQKLLLESHLNITHISECVGYQNITHFGRVFKSMTGLSPLKYRKLFQNELKQEK